jgi:hypothetical protein
VSLTLSALIKAAADKIGKPQQRKYVTYSDLSTQDNIHKQHTMNKIAICKEKTSGPTKKKIAMKKVINGIILSF